MVYVSIYAPSASGGQPPHLPSAFTTSVTSRRPITPLSVRQTASDLNQGNGILKDHAPKYRDLSQQSHFSDHRCRNGLAKEQGFTGTRDSTDSGDNGEEESPDISELLSGMIPKSASTRVGPDSVDNDRFVDTHELPSGVKQESINPGYIADKVDSGTRGGSPANCTRSREGSSQDSIILSDDESVSVESETDYSDLDLDPRARSESGPPHPEGGGVDDFGPGTTRVSAIDHLDDSNRSNDGVVNKVQLRLSVNRTGSASPGHESVTHLASKLQVNNGITQGSTSYVNIDVTKELEDGKCGISTKKRGEDDDDPRFKPSAIPGGNLAFNSGLRDGQPSNAQFPQLGPVAASLHQSDLSDHLPKQLPGRVSRESILCKHPHTTPPIRLASSTSATLSSTGLKEAQRGALIAAPVQAREPRYIAVETVDGRGTDPSSGRDPADKSDTAGSKIAGRPRSRKRARRTKGVETLPNTCDVEACPPTSSVDISSGTKALSLPDNIQESEEIPVHGNLKLKMLGPDVVYCLTVSQGSSQHHLEQKQDSNEEPQPTALVTPSQEWPICEIISHKMIDGEMRYFVGWGRSWLPKSEMGGAKELLDAYNAKLRCAQGKSEDGQESRAQKRSQLVVVEPDARDGREPKKRRGRPRKMR